MIPEIALMLALAASDMFEQMLKLEGEWEGSYEWTDGRSGGGAMRVRYTVTGAGSALIEDLINEEGVATMTTVYHLSGEDLRMTHYCAAGNQPRMKLNAKKSTAQELVFDFDGGTNLNPRRDTHMHSMVLTLPAPGGPQKIHVAGIGFDKGKEQPSCSNTLTRRN